MSLIPGKLYKIKETAYWFQGIPIKTTRQIEKGSVVMLVSTKKCKFNNFPDLNLVTIYILYKEFILWGNVYSRNTEKLLEKI